MSISKQHQKLSVSDHPRIITGQMGKWNNSCYTILLNELATEQASKGRRTLSFKN